MAIKDFDILMQPVTGGDYKDIAIRSSINLAFQQIENVLFTGEGELPFDKDFGSPYSLFEAYAGYQLPSIFPIAAAAVETDLPYVRNVNIYKISQTDAEVVAAVRFDYNREKTLSKNLELRITIPILE